MVALEESQRIANISMDSSSGNHFVPIHQVDLRYFIGSSEVIRIHPLISWKSNKWLLRYFI